MDRIAPIALRVGPYALLSFAGLLWTKPIVDIAASLGPNLLAPHLESSWERTCRSFLKDPALRTAPLLATLHRAIIESCEDVKRRWWETPDGQKEVQQAVLHFRPDASQRTEAAFALLQDKLLETASADYLELLEQACVDLHLGRDQVDTVDTFRRYLIDTAELAMSPALAEFVATELPPAVARAFSDAVFDPDPAADPLRFAIDGLTQRLLSSQLVTLGAAVERQTHAQDRWRVELARLLQLDRVDRAEHVIAPLQTLLAQQQATREELRQLSSAYNAAQAAKARIVPAADLLWGITGPRVDIRVPKWEPRQEQLLPYEQEAALILKEQRALVILGKASSGKTHLAGKLLRQHPDALVVIPQTINESPPPFESLKGREVVLFLDDFHQIGETFNMVTWWAALEHTCGATMTRILLTARVGDRWERLTSEHRRFIASLSPGSVFEIPELSVDQGAKIADELDLVDGLIKRFDGTIGSIVLDFSKMGDEYDRLARPEFAVDGVAATRLLDAAKLLRSLGQSVLREDMLRKVSEEVLGGGRSISPERWRFLKERTEAHRFGRFQDGVFVIYAPYLERSEVINYSPQEEELHATASLILQQHDAVAAYRLGMVAFNLGLHDIQILGFERAAELGHGESAYMLGLTFSVNVGLGNHPGDARLVDRAIRSYSRAVELGHAEAARQLAKTYLIRKGDRDTAVRAWELALEMGSRHAGEELINFHMDDGNQDAVDRIFKHGKHLGLWDSHSLEELLYGSYYSE